MKNQPIPSDGHLPLARLAPVRNTRGILEDPVDANAASLIDAATARRFRMLPFGRDGDIVKVAAVDPEDPRLAIGLGRLGSRYRVFKASPQDLSDALGRFYGGDRTARPRPSPRMAAYSAHTLLTRAQAVWLAATLALAALAAIFAGAVVATVLNAILQVLYAFIMGFKLWMSRRPSGETVEIVALPAEIAALTDEDLPLYSVLIPLHREAEVLDVLLGAIDALDYPKDRLDVKLLLEGDDEETLGALRQRALPPHIQPVVLRPAEPRTKPKALNEGLRLARGEIVVIYDAEDIPEPDQLKKALVAFRKAGPRVACIQAKLSYFNRRQNLLTRFFTAEYAMWFDLVLPALQAHDLPIPLGGTSNHVRREALLQIGGWDAFNVTEDADLGIRLCRAGLRTGIVNSTTYEEANSEFTNWVRQRSRWVKGYMQTWLVHMRHPRTLIRELGWKGFVGFQVMIFGTPFTFLFNPFYWALSMAWFLTSWNVIPAIFPTWVYYMAMVNLMFGGFVFSYMNMAACARYGLWDLVGTAALSPVYWGVMSVGAWKAALQLVTRPSHWEKTAHGLTEITEAPTFYPAGEVTHG